MLSAAHLLFISGIRISITVTSLTKVPICYHLILCNVGTDGQFVDMPWTTGVPPICHQRDNVFYLDVDTSLGKSLGQVSKVLQAQSVSGVTSSSTASHKFSFYFIEMFLNLH
jgi:hypothetical protein